MSIDPPCASSIITPVPKRVTSEPLCSFCLKQKILSTEARVRRVHNTIRILNSSQDSDSSKRSRSALRRDLKPYVQERLTRKASFLVAEIIPAILILFVPFFVHAGFFSKIFNVFTEEVAASVAPDEIDYSALNVSLLSAKKVADPLKAVGGGDVYFDDDGVLISTGPVGQDEIIAAKSNGEISVYVVREGDSLSQIAEMYGVTANTILWANDLQSAKNIHAGDQLVILPIVGVKHVVAKGETLSSIVKKYDGNLEEVLEYNNLASVDDLAIGDELMIPGGELHTAPAKVASASPAKSSGSVSSGAGFIHPLPGARRTQGIHGYNGVDLAAPVGTSVRAAGSGSVIVAKNSGWNGGYGNYVVVKHGNGAQTLYAHLSSVSVGVGETVGAGDALGIIGNTGRSTGTHLHFEVRGGTNPF